MSKISYDNWLSSALKWQGVKKRVQRKDRFVNSFGFFDLDVGGTICGYCREFGLECCDDCPLYQQHSKFRIRICHTYLNSPTHFSSFLNEMKKMEPTIETALTEAQIILNAILEDCPDENRAIRDGIIFE